MKAALLQMDIALGDVAANHAKAEAMMAEAVWRGAELIVLPELWTTGYCLETIAPLAEREADSPTLRLFQRFAQRHKVQIIGGSIPEFDQGNIYNTAYTITSAGEVAAKYRKIHLVRLMEEEKYLTPGDQPCLFSLKPNDTQAATMICYDLRFTELARSLALKGCQILFIPAEWPAVRGLHWRSLLIARAIENQMYVVAVNRIGKDASNQFYGHSLVVNPWGEVIAEGTEDQEEILLADIDLAVVAEVRGKISVFADRRPECY
ncbi:MAG: carbon-nitrogen family hydrolase [Sporomusaceae bacterium]|nr:carbon-nitrogen family hydrolase [Sporomusaceae bacterium]